MANYSTYGGASKIAGLIADSIKAMGGDPEMAHRVDVRHDAPHSDKFVTRNIILVSIEVCHRALAQAQGTEAQRATTVEQGVVHDGLVRAANAPNTIPSTTQEKLV